MSRFNIDLPDNVREALETEADRLNMSVRALAVQIIAAHYGIAFQPPQRGGFRGNPNSLKPLRPGAYIEKNGCPAWKVPNPHGCEITVMLEDSEYVVEVERPGMVSRGDVLETYSEAASRGVEIAAEMKSESGKA